MPGPNVRAYEALTTQFDNLKISNIIWTELTEKTCWSMKWRAINYVFWALFWLTLVKRLMTAMWIHDKHQNVAVVLVIDLLQILSHHGWHFPWLPWSSNGARKVNRYLIPRRLWFRSLSRRYARAQCESIWSIDNTIWQSQNIQYNLNRINGENLLEYEVTSHKLCVLGTFLVDSCQKTDDRHVDSRQAPECGCCPGHWFAPNLVTPWVAFPLTSVVLKWS